jgi:hypothetical protein
VSRWSLSTGLLLLGDPPGNILDTFPNHINDHGEIVGMVVLLEPWQYDYERAVLWDAQGKASLIDEFLDASSQSVFPLANAMAINNVGQILVYPSFSDDAYLLLPFQPGDMNCDGVVDMVDLAIFLATLASGGWTPPDPSAHNPTMAHELCGGWTGDMNQDGVMDEDDLQPFLGVLLGK